MKVVKGIMREMNKSKINANFLKEYKEYVTLLLQSSCEMTTPYKTFTRKIQRYHKHTPHHSTHSTVICCVSFINQVLV